MFRSRKGPRRAGLRVRQGQRLVDAAAKRAALRAGVSPHWLRHAHATHALERGAPIPGEPPVAPGGSVIRLDRRGGVLHEYTRCAA